MTKLVTVARDGWLWLAAEWAGKRLLLHRQGRVGECIRPGQRARHQPEGPCAACPHPYHAHSHARNVQARSGFR